MIVELTDKEIKCLSALLDTKEVPKGLNPMFYHTLSYEGDIELNNMHCEIYLKLNRPPQWREDYIKVEDLVIGEQYDCYARNFKVGTWNGESFDYLRTKFGSTFPDKEFHWDNGAPYGTVKPFNITEKKDE